MIEQVEVSIIIPIYNGADYIRETMNCIINQTYKKIEIIVVDDGSTDTTHEILKECIEKDKRIRYFYQEKSNAGAARNYGMQHARGKYLLFLDGDDLFENVLVEEMYNQAEKQSAEICVCAADHYDQEQDAFIPQKQYLVAKWLPEEETFSRDTNPQYIFNFTTFVPWNKLFKKKFVMENGIEFQSIERVNDQYFVMMCIVLAQRITVLHKVLVHYRTNQSNNLTNTFSKSAMCKYDAYCRVQEEFEQRELLAEEGIRRSFVNKALNSMIYGLNVQTDIDGFQIMFDRLKKEGFERLGIGDYGQEYYYDVNEYKNYKYIIENDFQTYLLIKNREYRNTIRLKNYKYNKMIKDKNCKIAELKKKEKELNYIKSTKRFQMMKHLTGMYHKIFDRRKRK